MNLFDKLVTEALKYQPHLSALRVVVEKELLHQDIMRILSDNQLLTDLTFIGGTCLRSCYSGIRLSEDLEFTGGKNFTRENLSSMSKTLIDNLNEKYGFTINVTDPIKDKQNVDTWKITIETSPQNKSLPLQRIHIDICAVPSYEKRPMMLLNPYGIDTGTSGLIIQAQSREEIYTDKLIAFAFRPNRIKYRDLWDIAWLHGQGLKPRLELLPNKLLDRNKSMEYFLQLFEERTKLLIENHQLVKEFTKEMLRFLPSNEKNKILKNQNLWNFIIYLIQDLDIQLRKAFSES